LDGSDDLVCPRCRAGLDTSEHTGEWSCGGCASRYRSLRGIPDLRIQDDVYLPNSDDWSFALQLDADYDRLDFRGLLDRYFDLASDVPADLRERQVAHILSAPERARQWLEALGSIDRRGPMLDLGCGSGSFLAAVGGGGETRSLWGVDIAMRWLLVARKRLDEEGLRRIRLVCAEAERLPFRDRTFAAVVAGDVIEHVADQARTLAEAHRVLTPGGRLFLASPNRFSLAPEPHVGVMGVGFLPRAWMAPYVRWRRGVEFRAIRTLGFGAWKRMLAQSPFGTTSIHAPGLPHADLSRFRPLKRVLGCLYNRLVSWPLGQRLACAFGPLFHVSCTRAIEREASPGSSPATRRSTTPSEVRS
jgi:SAM-dependent methyltransferase